MQNNIVSIPYHDWRKIEREGFRTRDAHFIEHFCHRNNKNRVLVINRPTSYVELLYQRYDISLKGELVFKRNKGRLYKIQDNLYVLDYITNDIITPVIKKRLWLLKAFNYEELYNFYEECTDFLNFKNKVVISNNVFSAPFVGKIKDAKIVFDAFDNFLRFPVNAGIYEDLKKAYLSFVAIANFWLTNSKENVEYFKNNLGVKEIYLVKNGVDLERFNCKLPLPQDLRNIPRPYIGFGGKITHLFDYEILNYVAEKNPDKSFIILGQILDKEIFSKIADLPNIYYLGDKSYDVYAAYVTNFDLGIVPYVNKEKSHGGDSIKIYEYLAAGLKVVSTFDTEEDNFKEAVYYCKDKYQFLNNLDKGLNNHKNNPVLDNYTWRSKVEYISRLLSLV